MVSYPIHCSVFFPKHWILLYFSFYLPKHPSEYEHVSLIPTHPDHISYLSNLRNLRSQLTRKQVFWFSIDFPFLLLLASSEKAKNWIQGKYKFLMELSLNGVLKNNYVINKIIIKIISHMIYFKRKRKELCTFVVVCLWMVIWNSVKRWTSSIHSISYTEDQKNWRSSTNWSSQIRVSLCFHQWGYCKDEEMKCASLLPADKLWKLYAEWNKSYIKEHPDCPLALLVVMSLPLITQILC